MAKLLTVDEVAERLGLRSPATVYRWSQSGKLRRVVLGQRSIRFREEDVEAFVAEHLEGQSPDGDAA